MMMYGLTADVDGHLKSRTNPAAASEAPAPGSVIDDTVPTMDASPPGRHSRLPHFAGGNRPAPESEGRKWFIRSFALLTLAVTYVYLAWRIGWTIDLSVWWIALPLLALELHNALGLTLYTIAGWDIDVSPPWHPVAETDWRVAVLIPTYNEPDEVLLPTIAAAVALEPRHETWVLDDGRRESVRELAQELGARYLTRPDNSHAKAGNLNHALAIIEADIVAVLDADHVPLPGFLTHTLGYFDDPEIAVVQTPQDFYNLDSFEHEGGTSAEPGFSEEAVFYRVLLPGKNRWGGAFWCGTSALVRTQALRAVGGVATETVTEDIHTTIRMQRLGWKTVCHNEVLARGLAPSDAIQYMVQRNRWAQGAMQVLRREKIVYGHGLTLGQRVSYLTTLFGWFDSWRSFGYMLLPAAVVATGASPITAPGYVYGPLFLTALALQFIGLRFLARGKYPPILATVFEVLRMPAVLPATAAVVTERFAGGFRVTPKGRSGGERSAMPIPWLLKALCLVNVAALLWFAATWAGLTPAVYAHRAAAAAAAIFMVVNLLLLRSAIRRIHDARFEGERRASVRLKLDLRGVLDGMPCAIDDLSLTGAKILTTTPLVPGGEHMLRVFLPHGAPIDLECVLRRELPLDQDTYDIGLDFKSGQRRQVARLALAILNGESDAPAPEVIRERAA